MRRSDAVDLMLIAVAAVAVVFGMFIASQGIARSISLCVAGLLAGIVKIRSFLIKPNVGRFGTTDDDPPRSEHKELE